MYEKERTYLKWKYLYYNGKTEVSDSVFDKLEDELKSLGSILPSIVGSPNIELLDKYNLISELTSGEREVRFHHIFPMLSLKKYQITLDNNEKELFPSDIVNFFMKLNNKVDADCSPKFDGNSMELTYIYGELSIALTRGNENGGLDRTKYLKVIVPNTLPKEYHKYEKIIIRGEIIIQTELWEDKYSDPNKVDNPRNWLAGMLNADDTDINVFNDVDFLAYQISIIDDGKIIKPNNQLELLSKIGFDEIFSLKTSNYEDFFINVYPKFKDYRIKSKYALDGIVLTFPAEYWDELGVNNHHPHWACAVKFVPNRVATLLEDIEWTLGKDGELTPIATLKPVELDGTIVKHASLHNLGWIIENGVYPGCTVEVAKKGEIIPQIVKVISQSLEKDSYHEYVNKFIENHS